MLLVLFYPRLVIGRTPDFGHGDDELMYSAVAEAWVASDQKHRYASAQGLGQTFSFDMLMCDFKRSDFKDKIDSSLADVKGTDSSTTWVFSNHDVSPTSLCHLKNEEVVRQ